MDTVCGTFPFKLRKKCFVCNPLAFDVCRFGEVEVRCNE